MLHANAIPSIKFQYHWTRFSSTLPFSPAQFYTRHQYKSQWRAAGATLPDLLSPFLNLCSLESSCRESVCMAALQQCTCMHQYCMPSGGPAPHVQQPRSVHVLHIQVVCIQQQELAPNNKNWHPTPATWFPSCATQIQTWQLKQQLQGISLHGSTASNAYACTSTAYPMVVHHHMCSNPDLYMTYASAHDHKKWHPITAWDSD